MLDAVSSITTNSTTMVGVKNLTSISSSPQLVQTGVSIGYLVNSAVDNGAAFAIAQPIRTKMSGLTAANQQQVAAPALLNTGQSPSLLTKLI